MARPPARDGRQSSGNAFRKLVIWLSAAVSTIATSPTITAGTGVPTAAEPNGSVYHRTNGQFYLRVAGAWVLATGGYFMSAEQTGTGAAQDVAHGLAVAPTKVLVAVTEDPAGAGFDVAEGAHDATNVKVTVTTGVKFKVLAFV